ncbi:MAG: hypothetical protein ACI9JL_004172 [Paracoccaceae bacterium]|jgi:hypothetical protein
MRLRIIASVTALLALGACEYTGPAGDPVSRNLSWFDYVGAEGLRDACAPGASTRLRFVYNGIYDKQVRSYDLFALPDGRGASMSAWARGIGDLTKGVQFPNILSPWQGKRVESVLDPQTMANLLRALETDRFQTFKPSGLRLPSNEFYWVVTGCLDGRFHANAWMYPSDRFKALRFPAVLMANDRTGIALRAAVPVNQRDDDPTRHEGNNNPSDEVFEIQLGANRIVGAKGLF